MNDRDKFNGSPYISRMFPIFDPTNVEAGMRILEDITSKAGPIQEQVLEEILTKNANTEYLNGYLDGRIDKELFKNKVPIVEYGDIKLEIERIAVNGEPSQILTSESITELLTSSGTSGGKQKQKWIPKTDGERGRIAFFFSLTSTVRNKYLWSSNEGKQLFFVFIGPDIYTPGGLVATTSTKSMLRSRADRNPQLILCEDTKQSMYSQLLCGLVQRDEAVSVGTYFAFGFLRIIKFLEEHWQELSSNIRAGTMSDWITDPNCKMAISLILSKPMPNLADSIDLLCKEKSWKGIVRRLWPKTEFVLAIITGSMAQYILALEFYTSGLPVVSSAYASSEG